jgi:predicted Zn-dependent protease
VFASTGRADVKPVTDQEEIDTGRDIVKKIEPLFGGVLPEKSPLSVRVRRIGAQLARFSSRKAIHYSYKVLNNADIPNAFAAPGGHIYITKKLVTMARNDAELAYVLGHETGHVDRRHMALMVERQRRAQHVARVLGDSIFGKGKDHSTLELMTEIVFVVGSLGYSRQHELEADALGVRWMSRLGYDPRASIKILEQMRKRYPSSPGTVSRYLSTHPAPEIREIGIEDIIINEKLMDVAKKYGGPRLWEIASRVRSSGASRLGIGAVKATAPKGSSERSGLTRATTAAQPVVVSHFCALRGAGP